MGEATGLRKALGGFGRRRSRNKGALRKLPVEGCPVLIRGMEAAVHLSVEESARCEPVFSVNYARSEDNPDLLHCIALLLARNHWRRRKACPRSWLQVSRWPDPQAF